MNISTISLKSLAFWTSKTRGQQLETEPPKYDFHCHVFGIKICSKHAKTQDKSKNTHSCIAGWEICLFHENHIFAKNMMNLSAGNERIFLGHTFFFSCSGSNHCKSSWPLSVEATMTLFRLFLSMERIWLEGNMLPYHHLFLHIEGVRRKV